MTNARVVWLTDEYVEFVPVNQFEQLLWPVVESRGNRDAHFNWGFYKDAAYFDELVSRWRDAGNLKVFSPGGFGTLPVGSVSHGVVRRDDFTRLVRDEFNAEVRVADLPASELALAPAVTAQKSHQKGNDEWRELAQAKAREIISERAARDLFPSQIVIAESIAADFRNRTPPIHGTDGKPLSGATIKRHALKGISSATKKARPTTINRGK